MQWINKYQLFLLDFDGLLVDTEQLHYQAYVMMCAQRGFTLKWTFHRYAEVAYYEATGLRDQIYAEFPDLRAQESNWHVLYEEKKQIYLDLLKQGHIPLLPGVADFLLNLQEAQIKRCVVTHSASVLIQHIRKQNPILDTIPYWMTREDYTYPKPHSECYQIAIQKLAKETDQIIGFEDSPRGLQALLGTQAKPILICPPDSPYLSQILQQHPLLNYYPNFTKIQSQNAP